MRFLGKAVVALAAVAALSAPVSAFSQEGLAASFSAQEAKLQQKAKELVDAVDALRMKTQVNAPPAICTNPPDATAMASCWAALGVAESADCKADFSSISCGLSLAGAITTYVLGGGGSGGGIIPTIGVDQCVQSIQNYGNKGSNACGAVASGIKNAFTTAPGATTGSGAPNPAAALNSMCSNVFSTSFANCQSAIAATGDVQAACGSAKSLSDIMGGMNDILGAVNQPVSALCTPDGNGGYCFSSIVGDLANAQSKLAGLTDITKVDTSVLTPLCKPCVNTMMNQLLASGGAAALSDSNQQAAVALLNTVCVRNPLDSSKLCLDNLSTLLKMDPNAAPSAAQVNVMCDPCTKAIVDRILNAPFITDGQKTALKAVVGMVGAACARDGNSGNARCIDVASALANDASNAATLYSCLSNGVTCSDDCKTAVQNFFNSKTCCLATFGLNNVVKTLLGSPLIASLSTAQQSAVAAISTCQISVTDAMKCSPAASRAPIAVTINLPNLDFGKCNASAATAQQIAAAIAKDIAAAAGVDVSQINLGDLLKAAGNGVKVQVTINVDATLKAQYASAINQKMSSGSGLPMPNTATTASSTNTKQVSSQPMTATSASAVPSGAVAATSSLMIVFSAFVALLMAVKLL